MSLKEIMGNINKICAGMVSFLAFSGIGFGSAPGRSQVVHLPNIHKLQKRQWMDEEYKILLRAIIEANPSESILGIVRGLRNDQIRGRTKDATRRVAQLMKVALKRNLELSQNLNVLLGSKQRQKGQKKKDVEFILRVVRPNLDPLLRSKTKLRECNLLIQWLLQGLAPEKIVENLTQEQEKNTLPEQTEEEIKIMIDHIKDALAANPEPAKRLQFVMLGKALDQSEKEKLERECLETIRQEMKNIIFQANANCFKKLNEKTTSCANARKPWKLKEDISLVQVVFPYGKEANVGGFFIHWNSIESTLLEKLERSGTAAQMRFSFLAQASIKLFKMDPLPFVQQGIDPNQPQDQGVKLVLTTPPKKKDFKGPDGKEALQEFEANGGRMSYLELLRWQIKKRNKKFQPQKSDRSEYDSDQYDSDQSQRSDRSEYDSDQYDSDQSQGSDRSEYDSDQYDSDQSQRSESQ